MKKVQFTVEEFNIINGELELNLETNNTEVSNDDLLKIYDYAIDNELLSLATNVLTKCDDDNFDVMYDIKNDQLIY